MFVSLPEYQFPLPAGLAPPGALYWRTLTTTTNTAWYILKVIVAIEDDEELRTLLFWWDRDVVIALEQLQPLSIVSLACVLPTNCGADAAGGDLAPPCISVAEVWWARDADDVDSLAPLFIDGHGVPRSGLFAEPMNGALAKVRLVGRVGHAAQAGTRP